MSLLSKKVSQWIPEGQEGRMRLAHYTGEHRGTDVSLKAVTMVSILIRILTESDVTGRTEQWCSSICTNLIVHFNYMQSIAYQMSIELLKKWSVKVSIYIFPRNQRLCNLIITWPSVSPCLGKSTALLSSWPHWQAVKIISIWVNKLWLHDKRLYVFLSPLSSIFLTVQQ